MTARDACVKAKGKHFEHFCVLLLIFLASEPELWYPAVITRTIKEDTGPSNDSNMPQDTTKQPQLHYPIMINNDET